MKDYNTLKANFESCSEFEKGIFTTLMNNIANPLFPCYFSQSVIPKNSIHFSSITDFATKENLFEQAHDELCLFAELEKDPDPFRVFVLSMNIQTSSWQEDNDFMWEFIDYLESKDTEVWPEEVSRDTNSPSWSFCFKGMPFFFNLNSPNNTLRKSRNVTGKFSFLIQRTDSFEKILPVDLDEVTREERRWMIRKDIRDRIGVYDEQVVSPALAGEQGNLEHLEWVQYHIPNSNEDKIQSKCPFHQQV